MTPTARATEKGPASFLRILAWFVVGGAVGYALGRWVGSGSDWALVASTLMIPLGIWVGWGLIMLAAVVALPFLLPGVIRQIGQAKSAADIDPAEEAARQAQLERRRARIGWAFVLSCVPICFVAGLISGAPFTYLGVGLLAGWGMRRSCALQDVEFE